MYPFDLKRIGISMICCLAGLILLIGIFVKPAMGEEVQDFTKTLSEEFLMEKVGPVLQGGKVTDLPEEDRKYLFNAEQTFPENFNLFFQHGEYLAKDRKDFPQAVPRLNKALQIEPQSIDALELLAYCHQEMKEIVGEVSAWETLREILENPDLVKPPDLQEKVYGNLERMAAQNDQVMVPRKRFILYVPQGTPYAFIPEELSDTRLEDIFGQVTKDLECIPMARTSILVLTTEKFKEISPTSWAGAFASGGKSMTLPDNQFSPTQPGDQVSCKRVLIHEFTHNIVHALGGGKSPVWLNEGLAVFEESKDDFATHFESFRGNALNPGTDLIPVQDLEKRFKEIRTEGGSPRVGKAYALAYLYARYLIEKTTLAGPRSILNGIKGKDTFETMLPQVAGMSKDKFETSFRTWARENIFR